MQLTDADLMFTTGHLRRIKIDYIYPAPTTGLIAIGYHTSGYQLAADLPWVPPRLAGAGCRVTITNMYVPNNVYYTVRVLPERTVTVLVVIREQ